MLPLNAIQIRELRQLVQNHWTAFMVRALGPAAVGLGPDVVAALVRDGFLDASTAATVDPFTDAYLIGFLRERMTQSGLDPMSASWGEVKTLIAADPMPLQPVEQAAMEAARESAGVFITGLGNRLENDLFAEIAVQNDEARRVIESIQGETARAIQARASADTLASRLAEITGDYSRDWHRAAVTELMGAQEKGFARAVKSETGGDSRVAKLVNADACQSCVDAYCDPDGRPKIFTLEELEANGTNVGRKASEWLPTVGPMHPWCDCRLIRVPAGFEFKQNDDPEAAVRPIWRLLPST